MSTKRSLSLSLIHISLDFAEAGDNIGALLRGVDRTQIERGQVLAKPGSVPVSYTHLDVYKRQGRDRC